MLTSSKNGVHFASDQIFWASVWLVSLEASCEVKKLRSFLEYGGFELRGCVVSEGRWFGVCGHVGRLVG